MWIRYKDHIINTDLIVSMDKVDNDYDHEDGTYTILFTRQGLGSYIHRWSDAAIRDENFCNIIVSLIHGSKLINLK